MEFKVNWEIDVPGSDHLDAAKEALAIQRGNSKATVFDVTDSKGVTISIDVDGDIESEMLDKHYKITDHQLVSLLEKIGRVNRQVKLIRKGFTHVDGKDRMDIIVDCATSINDFLCGLE